MKRLIWILLLAAAPLAAQDSTATDSTTTKHLREGFWIRIGVGVGVLDGKAEGEDLESLTAPSGYIALGGTVSNTVGLGVTVNPIRDTEDMGDGTTTTGTFGLIGPTLFWHTARSPFYGQFAVGLSVWDQNYMSHDINGTGFGFMAGVGVDLRVARMLSITPYANYVWGRVGDMKVDGRSSNVGIDAWIIQLGAALTVH